MDVAANFWTTSKVLDAVVEASIKEFSNWEGERSKTGPNCRWIVLKKMPTLERGCLKLKKKMLTLFMDGP